MLLECKPCGTTMKIPHSCGHRSCPHCQHHDSQQWIERQSGKLLPVLYFLVTFTIPAEMTTHPPPDDRLDRSIAQIPRGHEVYLCLENDPASLHPVHPLIRAFGPESLYHSNGPGPNWVIPNIDWRCAGAVTPE
jgi:hypothetical protein